MKIASKRIFMVLPFLLITMLFAIMALYWIQARNPNFVSGIHTYGLPAYKGPCPDVVAESNKGYIELQNFGTINFKNNTEKKQAWLNIRETYIAPAFTLGQFCEDPEADGRLLYLATTVEFTGMIIGAEQKKQGTQLVYTYYEQAKDLGYNSMHPTEALWLRGRLERWALRTHTTFNY